MQRWLKGNLLACLLLTAAWPALAAPCPGTPVIVEAPPSIPVTALCDASAQALRFLAGYGLEPRRPILITLVDAPLHSMGHPVYGSYDSRTDRVQVMSQAAIETLLEAPQMYGEAFDADHYRGVIAHEVAHAVVQHNTPLETVSRAAQEYLAHATQLAALPPQRRRQIIAAAAVGPWEVGDVVSDVYMAFAPNRFAVKCYLHLTGHEAPRLFVHALINQKWRYVNVQ